MFQEGNFSHLTQRILKPREKLFHDLPLLKYKDGIVAKH